MSADRTQAAQYVDGDADYGQVDHELFLAQTTRLLADNTYGLFGKSNVSVKLWAKGVSQPRTYALASYLPRGVGTSVVNRDISTLNWKVVKVEWRFTGASNESYVVKLAARTGYFFAVVDAWWGKLGTYGDNDAFHFYVGETPF